MIENPLRQTLHRRHALKLAGALGLGVALPLTRRDLTSSITAQEEVWDSPPDLARAAEQAKDFQTYGMPDDWANYGGVFAAFAEKYGFVLGRTDTDMTSMEEITKSLFQNLFCRARPSDLGSEKCRRFRPAIGESIISP
jgi:putative spermidine/putrescine transport system substrate-binding protein